MSLQLKYRNKVGESITKQQVLNETNYQQLSIVDDKIKIIERRWIKRGKTRKHINYYLGSNENKIGVLGSFEEDINQTYTLSSKAEALGKYTLWNNEDYTFDKVLRSKGKHVLDEKFRQIMHFELDLISGEPKRGGIKYFYLGENLLYVFNYDKLGNLDDIVDVQYMFGSDGYYTPEIFLSTPLIQDSLFTWNDHLYYHSFYPLLPQGTL